MLISNSNWQQEKGKRDQELHDLALMVERLESGRQKLLAEVSIPGCLKTGVTAFIFLNIFFLVIWYWMIVDWFSILGNREAICGEWKPLSWHERYDKCCCTVGEPGTWQIRTLHNSIFLI